MTTLRHTNGRTRTVDDAAGNAGRRIQWLITKGYSVVPGVLPSLTPIAVAAEPNSGVPQTLVEVELYSGCTRKCWFCDPGIPKERRSRPTKLSQAHHERLLKGLLEAGFNRPECWIVYCGMGEPLLHPQAVAFVRRARELLPNVKICVYTNGDKLTDEMCCAFEAACVDCLHWDVYGGPDARGGYDKTAKAVPQAIAQSSLDPACVHVLDHVACNRGYSSRAGSCRKAGTEFAHKPCRLPPTKLFLTAKGDWLLCCEDYKQQATWPGKLSPIELNKDKQFAKIRDAVERGDRSVCKLCAGCDRDGSSADGFDHVPKLVGSRFWPAHITVPTPKGKRLVIMPVNHKWSQHARVILDAIDKASVMPGKSLVLWNDDEFECPQSLEGPTRIIKRYPGSLGWCGISRGIADGFHYAIDNDYDWAIKIDTDTAILRKGWDAVICGQCGKDEHAGNMMDVALRGDTPNITDPLHMGLFTAEFAMRPWSRRWTMRGARRWDHIQGGCYVFGVEALKRIDRVVGLAIPDDEQNIGEDVMFDTKAKIARVKQRVIREAKIWFQDRNLGISANYARYYRDFAGAVVTHAVKDLSLLTQLASEIQS